MVFLVDSWISRWIAFKEGYDPFFLNHLHHQNTVQPHPAVSRIFSLTMTYTARLIKANTQLLDMVSTNSYRVTHPPSHHARVRPRLSILYPSSGVDLDKTFVNFRRRKKQAHPRPHAEGLEESSNSLPHYRIRKSSQKDSILKPAQFRVVTHQH